MPRGSWRSRRRRSPSRAPCSTPRSGGASPTRPSSPASSPGTARQPLHAGDGRRGRTGLRHLTRGLRPVRGPVTRASARRNRGGTVRRGDPAGTGPGPQGRHDARGHRRGAPRRGRRWRSWPDCGRSCAEASVVTAGNASSLNDGASAIVVASEAAVERYGLTPRARILDGASAGVAPEIMGIGPVPATRKVLERTGLTVGDLGAIELNEAFASQSLAVHARAEARPGDRQRGRRRHRPRPPARLLRFTPGRHPAGPAGARRRARAANSASRPCAWASARAPPACGGRVMAESRWRTADIGALRPPVS